MQGTLPTELGLLQELEVIDLDENFFIGSFPIEWTARLIKLETLWLLNNAVTGQLPTELGNLNDLASVDISKNALKGTIPTELGQLTNLYDLYLNENEIEGTIPTELGNLLEINRLWLYENPLSGELPTQIQNLKQLTNLGIQHTDITGNIDGIVCTGDRPLPFLELYADCLTPDADVTCSCCTHCCTSSGNTDECEINLCPAAQAQSVAFNPEGTLILGDTTGAPISLPVFDASNPWFDITSPCAGRTGDGGAPTLWYELDYTFNSASSSITATTCSANTEFDTVVTIFRATSENAGCGYECVASNDDHGLAQDFADRLCDTAFQSFVVWDAMPGEVYYVVVSGFDETRFGKFDLAIIEN